MWHTILALHCFHVTLMTYFNYAARISKCSLLILQRLGVNICPPVENSLSTGALEGIGVLYRRNTSFTVGNFLRLSNCLASSVRYSSISCWTLLLWTDAVLPNAKISSSVRVDCAVVVGSFTADVRIWFIWRFSRLRALTMHLSLVHHLKRNCGKVTVASIRFSSSNHGPNRLSIPSKIALISGVAYQIWSFTWLTLLRSEIRVGRSVPRKYA